MPENFFSFPNYEKPKAEIVEPEEKALSFEEVAANAAQLVRDDPGIIERLEPEDRGRLASHLIDVGQMGLFVEQFSSFSDLGDKEAAALIHAGKAEKLREGRFMGMFHKLGNDTAVQLIESGNAELLSECFTMFDGLGDEVAQGMIDAGVGLDVAIDFGVFSKAKLSYNDYVQKLIDTDQTDGIFLRLGRAKFNLYDETSKLPELLNSHIADQLLEKGYAKHVAEYLRCFEPFEIGLNDLCLQILEQGGGGHVLLECRKEYAAWKACDGQEPEVKRLSEDVAIALINNDKAEFVSEHRGVFEKLRFSYYDLEILSLLCKLRDGGMESSELRRRLMLRSRLDVFVAEKLIGLNEEKSVVANAWSFSELPSTLDVDSIANQLIDEGDAESVYKNIDNLPGLQDATLLRLHIEFVQMRDLAERRNSPELAKEAAKLSKSYLYADEFHRIENAETLDLEQFAQEALHTMPGAEPTVVLLEAGFSPSDLLRYAYRVNVSRHDAFLASNDIAKLHAQSGLRPEQFCEQILFQVAMDGSYYRGSGFAHHEFNRIANRGIRRPDEVRAQIAEYEPMVRNKAEEILAAFNDDEDVFTSWRTLKAYAAKTDQLLNNVELLNEVAKLEAQGKQALADWYGEIAKSTSVDTKALGEFVTEPNAFFERDATHTPEDLHDQKKPSNYVHVQNLDLSPEQLRDALVEGSLDRLQSLPPYELAYRVAPEGKVLRKSLESLQSVELAQAVLGSRRNNVPGLTEDGGKELFGQLRAIINEDHAAHGGHAKIDVPALLLGEYRPSPEAEERIRDACLAAVPSHRFGKPQEYIVSIHPKSSPDGVLAGNDTACCMPFGDGKANVYMFNPACAQFTIQEVGEDRRRTLVQSVLSLDVDTGKPVPELLGAMNSAEANNIADVLPEEAIVSSKRIVVADNAEAAPNFKDKEYSNRVSELLYADFFARYLPQAAATQDLDAERLLIGEQYSDVMNHLPKDSNTFVPVAPVSYSDNVGPTSYRLDPKQAPPGTVAVRELLPVPDRADRRPKAGVSGLTFEDAIPVAYLEGKAYSDNRSLMANLHTVENGLIAKDIANAHLDRPNLSFKYADASGKMRGYVLAYEGKWSGDDGVPGERCVYVSDLASDKQGGMTGGRLIKSLLEAYKQSYLDKNDAVPVYCEARESTSYQIITSKLPAFARELGVELRIEELNSYRSEGDTMRVLRIAQA